MDSRRKKFDDTANDHNRFCKRVGKVWLYDELKFLGLEPNMLSGEFWPEKAQSLLNFCEENPEYHILSCKDYKIYNNYIPDASSYHLADGDADRNLKFDFQTRLSGNELLQIGHTMFAPVVGNIKSRHKP